MKSILILCCLLAVSLAAKDKRWDEFKAKFSPKYKSVTEEAFRKKIFLNNLMYIDQHNRLHDEGRVTFRLGVNQFADLTTAEFTSQMNGYRGGVVSGPGSIPYAPNPAAAPASMDWRTTNCVTPVKDQGQCGSCWSFSSTGSTEFYTCQGSGKAVVSLSEQNLMDCTLKYQNLGCNGGWMNSSFQYIIDNKGIDTEASYPYEEASTFNCRYNAANSGATLSSFVNLPCGDENALLNAVGTIGVASIAIDASRTSFQFYTSGTYYEPLCDPAYLDHAVLAVGYGNDGTNDYWLVKNSWGTSWGIQGYIQMSRNRNNNCGVASAASYPVV